VKAFILAGGLGTRLKPRFGDLPKSLAPLQGRPFLERQFEWLARSGVRDVVVCAGYGADQLQATLGASASALGIEMTWSVESEPLGTGGALALAAARVRGPALVVNGDTLMDVSPWLVERDRWEHGALGTLALFSVPDAASRGRVEVDEHGTVLRFVEKDPEYRGSAWVSGGMYAFSPALWRALPRGASSLERDVLPGLAAQGLLRGVRCAGEFFDIGTPEEWERAERRIAT
jgi:NDP-sugar pyrophosphorylase family protein